MKHADLLTFIEQSRTMQSVAAELAAQGVKPDDDIPASYLTGKTLSIPEVVRAPTGEQIRAAAKAKAAAEAAAKKPPA